MSGAARLTVAASIILEATDLTRSRSPVRDDPDFD
jgi:hypothetical protein